MSGTAAQLGHVQTATVFVGWHNLRNFESVWMMKCLDFWHFIWRGANRLMLRCCWRCLVFCQEISVKILLQGSIGVQQSFSSFVRCLSQVSKRQKTHRISFLLTRVSNTQKKQEELSIILDANRKWAANVSDTLQGSYIVILQRAHTHAK